MFPVSHSLSTDHGLGAQTRAGLGSTRTSGVQMRNGALANQQRVS